MLKIILEEIRKAQITKVNIKYSKRLYLLVETLKRI